MTRLNEGKPASISIQGAHHLIEVGVTSWEPGEYRGKDDERHVFHINVDEAERMLQNLISALGAVRSRLLYDAMAGECKRCGNLRMVYEDKPGGRKEQVYCSCVAKAHRPVPTMPAIAEHERAIMR